MSISENRPRRSRQLRRANVRHECRVMLRCGHLPEHVAFYAKTQRVKVPGVSGHSVLPWLRKMGRASGHMKGKRSA